MPNSKNQSLSEQLNNLKSSVLGVSLANKSFGSDRYEKVKNDLKEQLALSGETMVGEPKPFYKKGVDSPAGYVIETDKAIMVSYHGTQFGKVSGGKEILHDLQMNKSPMKFGQEILEVHAGFKKEYESSRESMLEALASTVTPEKPLKMSGHSLGAAVAQIAALDIKANGIKINDKEIEIESVSTFGGPRVFSHDAAKKYHETGLSDKTLRVKQKWDIIPKLPPKSLFSHAGNKISLDAGVRSIHSGSVYRKIASNKIQEEHIENARPADSSIKKPASIESYVSSVKELTLEKFSQLKQAVSKISATKIISGFKNIMYNSKTATPIPPLKRISSNRHSL